MHPKLPNLGIACNCSDCNPGLHQGLYDPTPNYLSASKPVRTFDTGATRDQDTTKHDFEGFLSPAVLNRFAEYMHKHRFQSDGSLRDSDNWQKGIPQDAYMKSLLRHVMTCWTAHREGQLASKQEDLCAVLFNVQGLLFELLRNQVKPIAWSFTTPPINTSDWPPFGR